MVIRLMRPLASVDRVKVKGNKGKGEHWDKGNYEDGNEGKHEKTRARRKRDHSRTRRTKNA